MTRFAPLLLLAFAGCGPADPAVHPVEGTALFLGKPAAGFTVEFASQAEATKGLNARGQVKPDGTFTLTTTLPSGKEQPGAVAGPHSVVVVPPPGSSGGAEVLAVPFRYAEYKTSGLAFEVKPGEPNAYKVPLEP